MHLEAFLSAVSPQLRILGFCISCAWLLHVAKASLLDTNTPSLGNVFHDSQLPQPMKIYF